MDEGVRLEVTLRHRIGAISLDVAFALTQPWTVLFAPSGAGKSTVLRIIAGLLRPDAGRVAWTSPTLQDRILTDTVDGIFIPPHHRLIRFVSQQPALFPHRTVLQNVNYGAKTSPHTNAVLTEDTDDGTHLDRLLTLCRIDHLTSKMPTTLSGGERQRVAIARAIAPTECRALLLDEPFSGLDTALREELLADLKPWLARRRIPVLQITHDVGEVLALGADVIKMNAGKIVAHGPARLVLQQEQDWLMRQLWFPSRPNRSTQKLDE